MRAIVQSSRWCSTMTWRAVLPSKFLASTMQPLSISASMISLDFAQCRGVPPFLMSWKRVSREKKYTNYCCIHQASKMIIELANISLPLEIQGWAHVIQIEITNHAWDWYWIKLYLQWQLYIFWNSTTISRTVLVRSFMSNKFAIKLILPNLSLILSVYASRGVVH